MNNVEQYNLIDKNLNRGACKFVVGKRFDMLNHIELYDNITKLTLLSPCNIPVLNESPEEVIRVKKRSNGVIKVSSGDTYFSSTNITDELNSIQLPLKYSVKPWIYGIYTVHLLSIIALFIVMPPVGTFTLLAITLSIVSVVLGMNPRWIVARVQARKVKKITSTHKRLMKDAVNKHAFDNAISLSEKESLDFAHKCASSSIHTLEKYLSED